MSGAMSGAIAELLRHSGTSLVKRYAHLSDTHLRSEIEKVAAFGKAGTRPSGEKAAPEAERETPEVVTEEPAKVERLAAELTGTVTGTVTGANPYRAAE